MSQLISQSALRPPEEPYPRSAMLGRSSKRKQSTSRMAMQGPADECAAMAPPSANAPYCVGHLKEAIAILPMRLEDRLHVRQLKTAFRILRLPQLEQRTGLKHSSIYARLSPHSKHYDPRFPRQVSLAAKTSTTCHRRVAVGWIESEVDAYLEQLSLERFSK